MHALKVSPSLPAGLPDLAWSTRMHMGAVHDHLGCSMSTAMHAGSMSCSSSPEQVPAAGPDTCADDARPCPCRQACAARASRAGVGRSALARGGRGSLQAGPRTWYVQAGPRLWCVQARHKQVERKGGDEPGPIATGREIVAESGVLVRPPSSQHAFPAWGVRMRSAWRCSPPHTASAALAYGLMRACCL